jgi:acyl carrier protein
LADLKQIIAEQLGISPARILERHTLVEDLGCDSLLLVEIAMEAEEQFGIPVPDEFLERIRTVGDVADGVMQLLGQAPEG